MKITVPESSQPTETQHGSLAFVQIGGVQYPAVRIRLTKNLSDFNDKRYVAGAELVAGLGSGRCFWLPTVEPDGIQGAACLDDGEFEVLDETALDEIGEQVLIDESTESTEATEIEAAECQTETSEHAEQVEHVELSPSLDVFEAETRYLEAAREVERIHAEIERLQDEHQEAVDHHRRLGEELCRVLERRLRETLAETECEVKIKSREAESLAGNQTYSTQSHSSSATAISEQPTGDYSNLTAAISELWADNPIERFGPKKQEAMIDACPTIGDFERLREQAGRSFRPLHSLLPDKIGELVADELENRFVDWWKKNAANSDDCVDYTTKPAKPTKTASESVDISVDMAGYVDMGPQCGPSSVAKVSAESSQAIQQIEDAAASPAEIESDDNGLNSDDSVPDETESDTESESENPYQF